MTDRRALLCATRLFVTRKSCVLNVSPFENVDGNTIGLMIWLNGVRAGTEITVPSALTTECVAAATTALYRSTRLLNPAASSPWPTVLWRVVPGRSVWLIPSPSRSRPLRIVSSGGALRNCETSESVHPPATARRNGAQAAHSGAVQTPLTVRRCVRWSGRLPYARL